MTTFYFDKDFQKYDEEKTVEKLVFLASRGKKYAMRKLLLEAGHGWFDMGAYDYGEQPKHRSYPKIDLYNKDGSLMTEEERNKEALSYNLF